jgi:hypothetical protein
VRLVLWRRQHLEEYHLLIFDSVLQGLDHIQIKVKSQRFNNVLVLVVQKCMWLLGVAYVLESSVGALAGRLLYNWCSPF